MRYTFELPSPEYELVLAALRSACVHRAAYGANIQVRFGRTSPQHRAIIAEIEKLNKAISVMEEARNNAVPERAVQSSETPARNAGDEMRLVYGRPRNDPRDARTGTARYPRK
jgi:hypothetical protein